jgi:serpin B
LLKKGPPPDLTALTRLVLTNAIYFKGDWAEQFDKKRTVEAPFTIAEGTKKNVPMMNRTGDIRYMETESFQAVELPYKGGELAMVVLLPRKHDGLPMLEKELTTANLDGWLKKMRRQEVQLSLPKFRSESRFQLGEQLIKMGMPKAFQDGVADFTGMNDGESLCIAKVIHQAFVEVNEEGTEAAAATAVVMRTMSAKIHPTFRADHPFVYLIRDTKTGNILFLGRYTGL